MRGRTNESVGTLAGVRQFDGETVAAYFTAAAPAYACGRETHHSGRSGKGEDAEWSALLKGNRLQDVREGDRLMVWGVLRVIEYPPTFVNGEVVPA